MRVLISVLNEEEAAAILDCGLDLLDVKNVAEGALGAPLPWVLARVVDLARRAGVPTSAALGDLAARPGTAALAAAGAAQTGVDYVKAGLHGVTCHEQALALLRAVRQAARALNPAVRVVAAGYADWRTFGGLDPADLVRAAADGGCDGIMLDTATKDGRDLFDHMAVEEVRQFLGAGRGAGLSVTLAGSLGVGRLPVVAELEPDLVGVRGAVCTDGSDRASRIDPDRARRFCSLCHQMPENLSPRPSARQCPQAGSASAGAAPGLRRPAATGW